MPRKVGITAIQIALAAKADGATDLGASQLSGVPLETIRTWRQRGLPRYAQRVREPERFCGACGGDRHRFGDLPARDYAYLLGIYLGDGHLLRAGNSWSLRIALDAAYPGIVRECVAAVAAFRGLPARTRTRPGEPNCIRVDSGWRSWACVLPHHGHGPKHERRIALTSWQHTILDTHSPAFLRGLIHSDGWRGLNRVHVKGRDYAYPRYQFSNRSDDIRKLFTDACDRLGIAWRPWTRFHISVAQRDSVARLDAFVGPKT